MDEIAARQSTLWPREWSWPRPKMAALTAGLVITAVVFRLLWDRFLDPFEDGYQNWWIASSFVQTGVYSDPYAGMLRGNWLPGYTFFLTGLVASFGSHIMPLMKGTNILFSLGTTAAIYFLARPRGRLIAAVSSALFVLNPSDIVISSFATPESLTLLAAFAGVLFIERRPLGARRSLIVASVLFLLASTLRYEAWGFIGAYLLWTWRQKGINRQELTLLATPALVFMAAWWLWTTQYGFLPAIIVNQTSTDVRYKQSIGALAPLTDRLGSFFGWYLAYAPLAALALAWAAYAERKSQFAVILTLFYGAEIIYTLSDFGNPSPRYIHLTVPIVCIFAAQSLVSIGTRTIQSFTRLRTLGRFAPVLGGLAISLLLSIVVVNPSPPAGFLLGGMQRAGTYLSELQLPSGKLLVSESPIAAYYSGYPASLIIGSSFLPTDAQNASSFLVQNAEYVVMVTVQYYRLRTLFPEQANGVNGNHLVLLYDATGAEYDFGAPRVLVFQVVP